MQRAEKNLVPDRIIPASHQRHGRRHWQRDCIIIIIIIVCIREPHYLPKYVRRGMPGDGWTVSLWLCALALWLLQLTNKSFRSAAINGNTSQTTGEDSARHSLHSLVLGHLTHSLTQAVSADLGSILNTSSSYYYQFSDDVNLSPLLVHHVRCMHYKSAEQNMHSQLHK